MRVVPPSLDISWDEGFEPSKDIFRRANLGRGLTNLIEASSDPLVIAVEGRWGTGKSTFLKMWAGSLRKANFPVIYFDAFEHDYVEDAFTAIAGEIVDLANEKKLSKEKRQKLKKAAVAAGKVLLKASLTLGAKVATAGILDAKDLTNVATDAKDAVGDVLDKFLEQALTTRRQQRDTLAAFKSTLAELPSLLGDSEKPLVFIIDELDRCRPSFALEVLERIKHLFSVPHVHFVLGVHIDQLQNSVRASYGAGIDASLYLEKFIFLTIELESQGAEYDRKLARKFIDYLEQKMEFKEEDKEDLSNISELFAQFAQNKRLTLRTIERAMSIISITMGFTGKNSLRLAPIVVGLVLMRVTTPELYSKAKRGELTYQDVVSFFGSSMSEIEGYSNWFMNWWRYSLNDGIDEKLAKDFDGALFRYNIHNRKNIVPLIANKIIDRFALGS